MTHYAGRCLCGAVHYQIDAEPLVARICWCRTCQKIAGNGTANALFPAAAIAVTGDLACYVSTADSGNQISRQFCPACGSHLFASSSANALFRVVRIGTLDEPSAVPPQLNIWSGSAPNWACLDPALRAEVGQPPLPAVSGPR